MGIVLIPLGIVVAGLYLWVVVKGVRWAYRRFAIPGGIVALIAFLLLPTWDTIANLIYHDKVVCKKPEIGLHVLEVVSLSAEFYDAQGMPQIFDRNGNFDKGKVGNRYKENAKYVKEGGWLTGVVRYTFEISDVESGRVLARFTEFYAAGGGWVLLPLQPLFKYIGEYAFRNDPQSCLDLSRNWIGETATAPFLAKNRTK